MDDNNTACKILMTKTELRKSLDFVCEERERLQEELEDYKSRIEKAVEYIKENAWYMNKDDEEVFDRLGIEGLLKILEGSNNE